MNNQAKFIILIMFIFTFTFFGINESCALSSEKRGLSSLKQNTDIIAAQSNNWSIQDLSNIAIPAGKTKQQVLVESLLGNNVVVKNIKYSGPDSAAGIFKTGDNIIGFQEGIILSTGSLLNIPGPNSCEDISAQTEMPGDTDLDQLIPGYTTFDGTVLEFDFVPSNNTITFQYVFASEEYNEYVNDEFNDVFGFFVNGQNIAKLPNTNTTVSINNVNGGNPLGTEASNPQYYINNVNENGGGFIDTEMDGLTVVLSVSVNVKAGQYNHIKLAIADAGDDILDSNVFIKAGSFTGKQDYLTGLLAKDFLTTLKDYIGCPLFEPIDGATGAHIIDNNVLTVQGTEELTFNVHYNSLLLNEDYLGKGWGHNYAAWLEELPDGLVKVHWDSNKSNTFVKDANENYSSPDWLMRYDKLLKGQDGTFTLTQKNQEVFCFDAEGRLVNVKNGHGKTLALAYDALGRLITISEPISKQTLSLNYNVNGLIDSVSDKSGRKTVFTYDNNHNLIKITDAEGQKTTYTYNGSGQVLTAVNNEGWLIFKNTYDEFGRVSTQDDAISLNQLAKLSYDEKTQPGKVITQTTDRNGNARSYTFNSKYLIVSETDELGNLTEYEYDDAGNCTRITDSKGSVTSLTYDDQGNVLTRTDSVGNVTTMTHDESNNLLSLQNAAGKTMSFTYDENNNLTQITDPLGNTTEYSYDENGLLLSSANPKKGTTYYSYENGRLHTVHNPENVVFTIDYDDAGRIIGTTNGEGKINTIAYDAVDNIVRVTDPLGNNLSYMYDSQHNKVTETDAKGNIINYGYNQNGKLESVTDPLGNKIQYEYDGEDRLIQIIDALNHSTTFERDAKGRVIGITDSLGSTVSMQYDSLDNLVSMTDASGNLIAEYTYDQVKNLLTITNALGNQTTNTYNKINQISQITDPLGHVKQYDYDDLNHLVLVRDAIDDLSEQRFDANGNLIALIDPNHNQTDFSYDEADRLKEVSNALGSKVTYTYNALNLLTEVINARGQVTNCEYDDAGRISKLISSEGTIAYLYDQKGNVLEINDGSGTISREYDALDRVTKYTDANGKIIEYQYDAAGNLVELTYPGGKKVKYAYDAMNKLMAVTDWSGRITAYAYDINGRLIKTTRPNGTVQTLGYDQAGQLLQQKEVKENGEIISQYDFTYDAAGNVLTEESIIDLQPFNLPSLKMQYGSGNRLIKYNGEAIEYDADGNMLKGPLTGTAAGSFVYDSRNRLIKAEGTEYFYDAEGNRTKIRANGDSTQFVINPNTFLSQVLIKTIDSDKDTYYIYGLGLIAQEENDTYTTYHFDRRGSTIALTDELANVKGRYQYTPYGKIAYSNSEIATPFLFNGRDGVMSDHNGLYYMRARYYNAEIKRFINQDRLLGDIKESQSLNRYAYVNGRPVSYIDPFGLQSCSDNGAKKEGWWTRFKRWLGWGTEAAVNAGSYALTGSELITTIEMLPDITITAIRQDAYNNWLYWMTRDDNKASYWEAVYWIFAEKSIKSYKDKGLTTWGDVVDYLNEKYPGGYAPRPASEGGVRVFK